MLSFHVRIFMIPEVKGNISQTSLRSIARYCYFAIGNRFDSILISSPFRVHFKPGYELKPYRKKSAENARQKLIKANLSLIGPRISLYGNPSNPHHFQFVTSTFFSQGTSSNGFESWRRKCSTGKACSQLVTKDLFHFHGFCW